jgi:hypothetical protein
MAWIVMAGMGDSEKRHRDREAAKGELGRHAGGER